MIEDILQREFYHNRVSDYLLCLAIIAGGVLAVRVVEALAWKRLKSLAKTTPIPYGDFLVDRIRGTGIPLLYLGIVQASLRVLTLSPRLERVIDMAGIVLLTLLLVADAVDGMLLAFERGIGLGAFNLGSGQGTSIRDLVTAVMRAQTEARVFSAVTWQTLVVSMGASAMVGLLFGTYPALRTARLSPVDAIMRE